MGSYLVIDGKENNTKSISYPMGKLLREIFPKKSSISEESVFALTKEEVARVLYYLTNLLDDGLDEYIKAHSEDYGMNEGFEKIKENFEWMHRCFAEVLSETILQSRDYIFCHWE